MTRRHEYSRWRSSIRWLCGFPDAALAQQEIVTLSTRPGVTQSYFLTSIPKDLRQWQFYFQVPAA